MGQSVADVLTIQVIFLARFFGGGGEARNKQIVLGCGSTELNQVRARHRLITGAPEVLLQFMCCSVSKPDRLKAIWAQNRGQISCFLTPIKVRGRVGEMPESVFCARHRTRLHILLRSPLDGLGD